MIGVDTNVIIRYLIKDDEKQSKKAVEFIKVHCTKENPAYLNCVVLCEIFWVLESCYKYSLEQISGVIERLLKCPQIEIEAIDEVWTALHFYANHQVDFADALIGEINKSKGCDKTVSFDKGTKKLTQFLIL